MLTLTTMGHGAPNIWWIGAACYGAAVISAVIPWVNAEVLMLAAVPLAGSQLELGTLVALVAVGQMTGKSVAYWFSRTTTRPRTVRLQNAIDQWRTRVERYPHSALGMVFISATFGVPPFYIVAVTAGALHVAFARFLVVGTIGRLVHFALVALAPQLVGGIS